MNSPIIKTKNLCRYFKRANYEIKAIDNVDMEVKRGEFLALVGSSGSGKSTLLALMAGLDAPTSGTIMIGDSIMGEMSPNELSSYRANRMGTVFQSFNLIPHRTALQNVELAMFFNNTPPDVRTEKAISALEKLGLSERMDHRPSDLSGGEQQRVAIARALVKKPDIIFADEPTGNLDQEHSNQIVSILKELNGEGITIIMVTHDLELAQKYSERIIKLVYGKIESEEQL